MSTTNVKMSDYNTAIKPTWCPGCGDFAIQSALKMALVEQEISPNEVVITYDIGCNGNGADKMNAYGFKGLHGRSIPVAVGAKLANQNLHVIATGGDGGVLDEGIHHFIHSIRSNYNITFIMHNNCNFGLTTGQETPTTPKSQPMVVSPWGVITERLNPSQLALTSGVTFLGCTWSGDIKHMKNIIISAMKHKGFGFVNIFQHCPTYNKFEDIDWLRERVEDVEKLGEYDSADMLKAYEIADYKRERRAIGVLYQDKESIPYSDRIPYRQNIKTQLVDEVETFDVSEILKEFD